jgi:hypothetical protein
MAGFTRQLDLQSASPFPKGVGAAGASSVDEGITQAIIDAGNHQRALKIDLITPWWSTRLYLIAALANRLTQARRIQIVDSSPTSPATQAGAPSTAVNPPADARFVGQISTDAIRAIIEPKVPALGIFASSLGWLRRR